MSRNLQHRLNRPGRISEMLSITAYASGSSGNCYTVTNGKATVMLDCGLPFREIQRLTGYQLPDAVLVTHEHKDHSKAAADFLRMGVDVYMTQGTADALGLSGHRLHIMNRDPCGLIGEKEEIQVRAFPTQHDAKEPCGFTIDDVEDRILYATDTYYLRYRFPGITKMVIECNHSYDILRENISAGRLDPRLANRLMRSHFSLENVLDFLRANDLSTVKEIWLIHLSDDNADPVLFERAVAEATGKAVYVACKRSFVQEGV